MLYYTRSSLVSKKINPDPENSWNEDWELYFSSINDPRVEGRVLHPFKDVIMLSLIAILAGAESWVEVELFGEQKFDWLSKVLTFPNGIPSHDTIGRLFSIIDSEKFQKCFIEWARSISEFPEDLISMDGKALRGSNNFGESPVTIVSAWSANNKIVLGQVKTDKKSNEITALPKLIDTIDLSGSIVSIDAAGCQKNIAKCIIDADADYLLALKGNQGNLRDEVESFLSNIQDENVSGKNIERYQEDVKKNHGRIEQRTCLVSNDISLLPTTHAWEKLNTVVMIESLRHIHGKTTAERRYFISSAKRSANEFLTLTRGHWGIENSLHWVLDVNFREDQCRVRAGQAAENFSILRHLALNLIKKDTTFKGSQRVKRKRAGWDDRYLLQLLRQF